MFKTKNLIFYVVLEVLGFVVSTPSFAQSLDTAIQIAIDNNPDIQVEIQRRLISNQELKQAESELYPHLEASSGMGREVSKNPITAGLGEGNLVTLNRYESALTGTQHLFTGSSVPNEIRKNRWLSIADAFRIQNTAMDIALNTSEQYLNVLKEQRLIEIAKRNIETHRTILQVITLRAQAGIDRQADRKQAQGRLDLAQANLIAEVSKLQDAEARYIRIVGMLPGDLVQPKMPIAVIPNDVNLAISLALEWSPLLKAADANVKQAYFEKEAVKSNSYPTVDLVFGASRNRNLDGVPGDFQDQYVMVRANYKLYQGGKLVAQQKESAHRVCESIEIRNRVRLIIEETVRLAWNSMVYSHQRVIYLQGHVAGSLAAFKAYTEQYKIGKRTLFDLLNQQNEFYNASLSLQDAIYQELYARYRLLSAMGLLLDFVNVSLPTIAQAECPDKKIQMFISHKKKIKGKALKPTLQTDATEGIEIPNIPSATEEGPTKIIPTLKPSSGDMNPQLQQQEMNLQSQKILNDLNQELHKQMIPSQRPSQQVKPIQRPSLQLPPQTSTQQTIPSQTPSQQIPPLQQMTPSTSPSQPSVTNPPPSPFPTTPSNPTSY